MVGCGVAIRQLAGEATSMDDAAQRIVTYLQDHLVGAALVRCYATRGRVLTLLAGAGDTNVGDDRAAIPLDDNGADLPPMLLARADEVIE